jgi:hypothetical protein
MAIKRRVYISSARDIRLDARRNELKWAIIDEIEKLGYEAQVFGSPDGGRGLAAGKSWSPERADEVMRRCVGAAVLGFPIWRVPRGDESVSLVTEYCHYEGAIARTYGLPILAVLEHGVEERVFFLSYGGDAFISAPAEADRTWVTTTDFDRFLQAWRRRLVDRRDVFLGYSRSSAESAEQIARYLEVELQATVWDWRTQFVPAASILKEIERAASGCTAGIFLFTRDDLLESTAGGDVAAPRDNVVFEAGYFTHAKGKDRVLIIREQGSKFPADLGGDIYAPLSSRADISSVKPAIRIFVEERL